MWTNLQADIAEEFLDAQAIVLEDIRSAWLKRFQALDDVKGFDRHGWYRRRCQKDPAFKLLNAARSQARRDAGLVSLDNRGPVWRRDYQTLKANPVRYAAELARKAEYKRKRRAAGLPA
jgi:hypothetical protein